MSDAFLEVAAAWKQLDDELDEMETKKAQIEEQIKEIKTKMRPYEDQLLELFAENEVNNIRIQGKTLYIHRQLWARPLDGDYEKACKVLREVGLDEYVKETVNINSISAYVREQDEMGIELPEQFAEGFKVDEVYQVRSKRSGGGKKGGS